MLDLAPFCKREDCRITGKGGTSTCMGWSHVYDKHGNQLNQDPNTSIQHYSCSVCKKSWNVKTRLGLSTIENLTPES